MLTARQWKQQLWAQPLMSDHVLDQARDSLISSTFFRAYNLQPSCSWPRPNKLVF